MGNAGNVDDMSNAGNVDDMSNAGNVDDMSNAGNVVPIQLPDHSRVRTAPKGFKIKSGTILREA